MPNRKERRCNLFDDNGRPRLLKDGTKGCSRDASECFFVHPHEREWKTAKSSHPPRMSLVADGDSKFYYVLADHVADRERQLDASGSHSRYDHRRESTTLIPQGPRGPSSTKRGDVNMGKSNVLRSRDRSPAHSTSSDQLEKLRRDTRRSYSGDHTGSRRTPPLDARRRDRSRSRSREHSRERTRSRERDDRKKPSSPSRDRVTDSCDTRTNLPSRSQAPPEPSKPPPPQPPPPKIRAPPMEPTFISSAREPSVPLPKAPKTLTLEEQRKIWHERVDLMFTSISSRRDYDKISNDLETIRLLSSSHISTLPQADLGRLNAQKESLEEQVGAKRKEVNDVIQKLMGSAWWPALRMPELTELEKAYGEIKKHVAEVRTAVTELHSMYSGLHKSRVGIGATMAPVPGSHTPHDSERPLKRQRVSEDADVGSDVRVVEREHAALEMFRDKLTALDHHLIELENDITQRDQIISDEIELQIDARLEDEDIFSPHAMKPEASPAEIEAIFDRKHETLVRTVDAMGVEIGELAQEVGELIRHINQLENRCGILEKENQELKNVIAECIPILNSQEDCKTDKEIRAVKAALQAFISQSSTGRSTLTPSIPASSLDYILESVDSRIEGILRDKFSPALSELRKELVEKLQENHSLTYETVLPKLRLLAHMLQLVTKHFDQADVGRDESIG